MQVTDSVMYIAYTQCTNYTHEVLYNRSFHYSNVVLVQHSEFYLVLVFLLGKIATFNLVLVSIAKSKRHLVLVNHLFGDSILV